MDCEVYTRKVCLYTKLSASIIPSGFDCDYARFNIGVITFPK